ncbi:MAG: hypothetical protein JWR01_2929 [Subtercola sp.]|nr:hypothetical protein [Subtercola sp.]
MTQSRPHGEKRKNDPANTPEERMTKLTKFLQRADYALTGPVFELRDMDAQTDSISLKMYVSVDPEGRVVGTEIRHPDVDDDALVAAITKCRVFILGSEDNYLPKIVDMLLSLAPDVAIPQLTVLKDHIDNTVGQGKLAASYMQFGMSQPDGAPGSDVMRSDTELALHYIYGHVVKEDDWRAEVLEHFGLENKDVKLAVLIQLSGLMHTVHVLRKNIRHLIETGDLPL